MEKRTVDGYIFLGTAIRFLLDSREGARIFGESRIVANATTLQNDLLNYEFHVTYRVLWRLWGMLEEFESDRKEHEDDQAWAKSRALSRAEADELTQVASTGRETLLAEAAGKFAYVASDKRYTVEMLADSIDKIFNPETFAGLPALAQFDFRQAGRGLAFETPTAAAFHLLRGTEAVLRDFYTKIVKSKRIAEPRMWGPMVADMRARRNPPPELLLTTLDNLRRHFRNPTQHPEKVYDMDEAQDLLALVVDAVGQMARCLKERQA
ncbi:hypothetical protein [Cellulosimicrobium cellulans]|uniref:hypothetical protein n=1 Tax=Cellulosimicrobium cellulans TaxID=1710 RepID=UPI00130E17D7|nr:hypothetical protein [Cellulosimicrobium cellulans]